MLKTVFFRPSDFATATSGSLEKSSEDTRASADVAKLPEEVFRHLVVPLQGLEVVMPQHRRIGTARLVSADDIKLCCLCP
jgi:hypothetical protein